MAKQIPSRNPPRGQTPCGPAVKVTLGTKGRSVVLDKTVGSPLITKDGVTVTKEIAPPLHHPLYGME